MNVVGFSTRLVWGSCLPGGGRRSREGLASSAQSQRTLAPITPQRRAQYKVLTIPAGDSVEDVFNALAQENFQYAGWMRRYGDTEFIFVKWVPVEPVSSQETSSRPPPAGFDNTPIG